MKISIQHFVVKTRNLSHTFAFVFGRVVENSAGLSSDAAAVPGNCEPGLEGIKFTEMVRRTLNMLRLLKFSWRVMLQVYMYNSLRAYLCMACCCSLWRWCGVPQYAAAVEVLLKFDAVTLHVQPPACYICMACCFSVVVGCSFGFLYCIEALPVTPCRFRLAFSKSFDWEEKGLTGNTQQIPTWDWITYSAHPTSS